MSPTPTLDEESFVAAASFNSKSFAASKIQRKPVCKSDNLVAWLQLLLAEGRAGGRPLALGNTQSKKKSG
jgi:hypothetical protein